MPAPAVAPQQEEESTLLEPGKLIERDLSAGQKHRYQIALSAGQFMKVEIKDHGTDVGVFLYWPNGDTTNPWQPVGEPFDVKPVSAVAESDGIFASRFIPRPEPRQADMRSAPTKVHAPPMRKPGFAGGEWIFRAYVRLRDQGRYAEAGPTSRKRWRSANGFSARTTCWSRTRLFFGQLLR